MNLNQLPPIPKEDDMMLLVEQLKVGLTTRATGGDYDNGEYQAIRELILAIPKLQKITPKSLKVNRTVDEFWRWVKSENSSYEGRRVLQSEQLNP